MHYSWRSVLLVIKFYTAAAAITNFCLKQYLRINLSYRVDILKAMKTRHTSVETEPRMRHEKRCLEAVSRQDTYLKSLSLHICQERLEVGLFEPWLLMTKWNWYPCKRRCCHWKLSQEWKWQIISFLVEYTHANIANCKAEKCQNRAKNLHTVCTWVGWLM